MAIAALSPSETSGIAKGARRNSISPGTLIGSRLVARIRSPAPPWRSDWPSKSGGVDDMLAVIELYQHVASAQQRHEAWERVFGNDADPERGCKGCRHQFAVSEGAKSTTHTPSGSRGRIWSATANATEVL